VKEIVIFGGPNGAGKTTAARKLLLRFPIVQEFLNADEFARAICPEDPESAAFVAGRRMLVRLRELVARGESFGLESTLSGKSYLRILDQCKQAGWRITLLYLWLRQSSELHTEFERVATACRLKPYDADIMRVCRIFQPCIFHLQTSWRYTIIQLKVLGSPGESKVAFCRSSIRSDGQI
jgi:hypothetical protein